MNVSYSFPEDIVAMAKHIKLLALVVDGVLTDGGMYYTKEGDVMKKFHARDGMGISILKRNKIPTVITDSTKVTGGVPKTSVGAVGDYAVVATTTLNKR